LGKILVRCKKCGFESDELVWDQAYHEITGKWRLMHEGQGIPHDCPALKSQKMPAEELKPLVKCPKCDPLSENAWMKRENLQEHLKVEHFGFW